MDVKSVWVVARVFLGGCWNIVDGCYVLLHGC